MGWHKEDDDYFMLNTGMERAQQQLAMFAIHLAMGNNVFCRRIQLGTIQAYIYAVAQIAGIVREGDIRKDNQLTQGAGKYLKAVYDELKRWEDEPNRREPITEEMVRLALKKALGISFTSLPSALADWYVAAIYGGFRCGEWAQTDTTRKFPTNPAKNARLDTQAFCLNDFRAVTKTRRHLTGAEIISVPVEALADTWTKWRMQKNGHHGVERRYEASTTSSDMCYVHATYRIIQRFVALRGADDLTTPLSVYQDEQGQCRLITSDDIAKSMRALAKEVYHLHPVKDLQKINRWSSHSLRVGACVFLHAGGFSPLDIKWLLRWESDAFMKYLRNFKGLSQRQTDMFAQMDPSVTHPTLTVPHPYTAHAA